MLNPLYLIGFEFYRGFPAEHRNQHLNLSALLVNLAHLAVEVLEGAVYDDDRIALREVYRVAHDIARSALQYLLHLLRRKRHGLVGGADEAGNLRRVAHCAPPHPRIRNRCVPHTTAAPFRMFAEPYELVSRK